MFHEPTCGCQSTFTLTDSVLTASLFPMLSDFIAALEQRLRLVEIISGFDRHFIVSGTLMTNTTDDSSGTVFKAPQCLDLLSHRSAGVANLGCTSTQAKFLIRLNAKLSFNPFICTSVSETEEIRSQRLEPIGHLLVGLFKIFRDRFRS